MLALQTFQPGPVAPQIEPVVDITFAEADDVGAVLFLPGGDRAIVQLRADAVDAWAALTHWWPEGLGVIAAIVALIALWRIARVLRRRQRTGEPYCRKCNYNLSGHAARLETVAKAADAEADGTEMARAEAGGASARTAGDEVRCPECGIDLAERPPRRGRATWRRLAPAAAVLVLVVGGYGGLHVAGSAAGARRSMMAGWLSMPSLRAEALRTGRGWTWMDPYRSSFDLLLEVDVTTGEVMRRVVLRDSSTYFTPAISPDGTLMALGAGQGGIDLVEVDTGRTRATLEYGDDVFSEPHRTVVFGPEGQWLYVAFVKDGRDTLARWNWQSGEREELTSFPAYVRSRPGGGPSMPVVRRYALLHRTEGLRILAAPSFSEAYDTDLYDLRIFDEAGTELARHEIDGAGPIGGPVVTPDGARAFLQGGPTSIIGFDLEAGESLGVLSAGMHALWDDRAISSDGRLLAVAATSGTILVRDVERKQWVAMLRHDPNLIAPNLWFSPDGRWLAANPFARNSGAAGGGYVHHLLIFDLSGIELEEADASGAGAVP